jgi:eukaryotic-like serine/threonine-protein kinase
MPAENELIADRFRLIRELGRGGMGSVWLAHHVALDMPCALKFIEGELADNPELRARFEREARAAAKLKSSNVVQMLDHGIWQGQPFIAMELLEGEDLRARLDRAGRLSPPETLAIVGQVARALTKAHALGIVHRDLKPDNIFLVRDDEREVVKVLDFGIAKSGTGAAESRTRTGALLGTPYYMSPEQASGTKSVDHRSDLWSLSVITFECLTGSRPFQSEGLGDLLVQVISGPIPVPSEITGAVPAGFDAWWARAATRAPDQRFQSAREQHDALALAVGQTLAAGSPSLHAPDFRMSQPEIQPLGSDPFQPPAMAQTGSGMHSLASTFGAAQPPAKKSSAGLWIALGGIGSLLVIGVVIAVALVVRKPADAPVAASEGVEKVEEQGPAQPMPSVEPAQPAEAAPPAEPAQPAARETTSAEPEPPTAPAEPVRPKPAETAVVLRPRLADKPAATSPTQAATPKPSLFDDRK